MPSPPRNPGTSREGDSFFTALYVEQREPVLRLLYRLTGDWSAAEDALQQAFATLYAERGDIDLDKPVRNLLVTIALNHARKAHRNRRRESPIDDTRVATGADPGQLTVSQERAARVERLVRKLEAGERAIVVLFYYERFSYQEIAEILSMPLGTVKWKMHHAFQKLRFGLEALVHEM